MGNITKVFITSFYNHIEMNVQFPIYPFGMQTNTNENPLKSVNALKSQETNFLKVNI